MRSSVFYRMTALLILILFLSGCQSYKKPYSPQSDLNGGKVTRLSKLSPSERRILTSRLSNAAAGVKGVKRAIVVLSSDNNNELVALVGLTLISSTAAKAAQIKAETIKKVKGVDRRITQVLATADPNMVKRISDIASGIIEGKPLKSYARDVNELNRMLRK